MFSFKKQLILLFFTLALPLVFVFSAIPARAAEIPACPTVEGRWLTPIYQVLKPQADGKLCGMGGVTANIWHQVMNIVNSLVLAAFIFIAFMNILRIQLDSYAVKKILPTFIMAVILANFSFLIARILLDFSNVFTSYFLVGDASATTQYKISGVFTGLIKESPKAPNGTEAYWGYIMSYGVKQLVAITGAVFILILSFLFLIRNYYIYFLVALAPAAYMAMVLPMTKKYFTQWWGQFTKWVFLPIVSVFWLWLAGRFMETMSGRVWFLPAFFAIVCFYMAMKSPFSIGGAAVSAWGNWGKKAWGGTGGKVTGYGKKLLGEEYAFRKAKVANRLASSKMIPSWKRDQDGNIRYAGLTPREIAAKRRQRLAGPRLVTEKQMKDADLEAMKYFLDKGKLDPKILGRYNAALRNAHQDEANTTFQTTLSAQLIANMRQGTNTNGRLNIDGKEFANVEKTKTHFGSMRAYQRFMSNKRNESEVNQDFRSQEMANLLGYDRTNDTQVEAAKLLFSQLMIGGYEGDANERLVERDRNGKVSRYRIEEFYGQVRNRANNQGGQNQQGQQQNPPAGTPAPAVPTPNRAQYQPATNQSAQPATAAPATPQEVIAQNDPELAGALQELVEALKTAETESELAKGSLAGDESIDKLLSGLKNLQPDNVGLAATLLPTINANITGITPDAMGRLNLSMQRVMRIANREAAQMSRGLEERNADTLRGIEQTLSNPNHLPPERMSQLADEGLGSIGENPKP